jgi:hypothetical protein
MLRFRWVLLILAGQHLARCFCLPDAAPPLYCCPVLCIALFPEAAVRGDGQGFIIAGGVVFGYSQSQYRLWAPNQWSGRPSNKGRIINIGYGWGNDMYLTQSNTADVRVVVSEEASPDYDSGWLSLGSQASTPNSYLELTHGLPGTPGYVALDGDGGGGEVLEGLGVLSLWVRVGSAMVCTVALPHFCSPHPIPHLDVATLPARPCSSLPLQYRRRVKVLTRLQSGQNQGFVFHGMGAAMADDDLSACSARHLEVLNVGPHIVDSCSEPPYVDAPLLAAFFCFPPLPSPPVGRDQLPRRRMVVWCMATGHPPSDCGCHRPPTPSSILPATR